MGTALVLLGLLTILVAWFRLVNLKKSRLPPGPKPFPIVGNVRDLTSKELWLRTSTWAKQFGDIVYMHVAGQGLSRRPPQKRGSIYSDRAPMVMAGELCGCENMVAFTRYGDMSRRQRRLMQQALGVSAIRTYQPLLEIETHALLKRILVEPEDYLGHIRRYGGGLTLLVIYGYRVTSNDDEFVMLAEECVDILSNKMTSGGGIWPVDIFPFLKHLPLWFPGAGFKHKAIEWKAKMQEFVDKPFNMVKDRMVSALRTLWHLTELIVMQRDGTAIPCFCTMLLDEQQDEGDKALDEQKDFDIRWTANSMYSGLCPSQPSAAYVTLHLRVCITLTGVLFNQTITAVSHFLLAMLLHPEVLAKAQEEIDNVVGTNRLPTFSDRPSLPYVDAVMSECLRWAAPVPLGLPHRLMEDDVYQEMYIPKGSLVFGNVWNMVRNEELFPNSDMFSPERYLEDVDEATAKKRDPRNYVFGFGRRKCPGVHLIESSLWIVMASILAAFDIKKAVDDFGNVVEPEIAFDNAIFRTPNPFKCDLRPRSETAVKVVRQAADAV
ncbi:O-methylsterigmatocystin oxidoreductase [Grifola frondosa]|uniref:O-methylsterigmatocystin oxidoreductase n=1 Tax=Grifola frondosa TaxID=5627 RepID=A0A1C7MNV1_GRIFR|nr:O-methylsterigmatocystin oxidoreductase [Grifola frondosa]